jgi:chemotaxis methyl-accepting protein methylase/ActR/RegA family two-component response regulator
MKKASAKLKDDEIEVVLQMAKALTGGHFSSDNHSVIFTNLISRMDHVKLPSFYDYLAYVDDTPEEMEHFISSITIHTTSWFREPAVFPKMLDIIEERLKSQREVVLYRMLCMACSTGEEVYSFAFIFDYLKQKYPHFDYTIEGWDIDPKSVEHAHNGLYQGNKTQFPENFRKYLPPLEQEGEKHFRIPDRIRFKCKFTPVNLHQPPNFDKRAPLFDFVTCRNVLIYFQPAEIKKIIDYAISRLQPRGIFCTGVSEVSGVTQKTLKSIGNAIYINWDDAAADKDRGSSELNARPGKPARSKYILICDDDISFRETLVKSLSGMGYQTVLAKNKDEAIEQFYAHSIQLVICYDRLPPAVDGLNLCGKLRALGYKGGFVITTKDNPQNVMQKAVRYACDDILVKPISFNKLTPLVQKFVGPPDIKMFPRPKIVLVGASTGGPELVCRMLEKLPAMMPPLFVVQHIAPNFGAEYGQRLAASCRLPLAAMTDGEPIMPGRLYISLGDYHIGIRKDQNVLRLVIDTGEKVHGQRPSVDTLFLTAAKTGVPAFAAIMTGMGRDGAKGLLALREAGAQTCAQNEATSRVFGMPKEAIRLNAASSVGSPEEIRMWLNEAVRRTN